MKLIFYPVLDSKPLVRPASSKRGWMDRTPESFAYRCLPLTIANSHGWEFLSPVDFTAIWDGGTSKDSIKITVAPGEDPAPGLRPLTHFGSGVMTFELNAVVRTEPGWNIFVTGPINSPKDGIAALTGVIETDWSPYTFTMNWLFTRANHEVRFRKNEPIAHIFPVQRGLLDQVEPEIRHASEEPQTQKDYLAWQQLRTQFNKGLEKNDPKARDEKWQKHYYRGVRPNNEPGAEDHQIKVRVQPVRDKRTSKQKKK